MHLNKTLFACDYKHKTILRFVLIIMADILVTDVFILEASHASIAPLSMTHGIASGDVTDQSAIIWSRANKPAQMHVDYDTDHNFLNPRSEISPTVNETSDFAAHVKLSNLNPDTVYHYKVWFSDPRDRSLVSNSLVGSFKTAPENSGTSSPITFIVGGDLGGQEYCRRVEIGYPLFSVMKELSPDFFVFNGDQIYGDEYCTEDGPADPPARFSDWNNILGDFVSVLYDKVDWTDIKQPRDIFSQHWAYNRADPVYQEFLRNVSMYSIADDHEVIDNYGNWSYFNDANKNRNGFHNVVRAGMDAFFSYSPIDRNQSDPYRIYRSFNWGKDLELFILDTHNYRSRNDLPNTDPNKTLLGTEQLHWLEQSLLNSNATWKVILNSVPLTVPNCPDGGPYVPRGCDNWANEAGSNMTFSKERDEFLNFLSDNSIKNVIFITTDIHYAANIMFQGPQTGPDGTKATFYELVSGPISAKMSEAPDPLDRTVNATYLYALEEQIFNFGHYQIQRESDGKVHFKAQIYDIDGYAHPDSFLDLTPQ
jgi:alkaline phosphatase D